MNVLITGGAGYIGTELAHELVQSEQIEHVKVFDNLSRENYNLFIEKKFNSNKISFIKGDILDGRRLEEALENIDIVYHLAAKVTTPYTDQQLHQYEQVNHWGTTELVSKIRNTAVSQVIYLSSAAVYGFSDDPFDEESFTNPVNHYGITKKRAEKEISLLRSSKKVKIVRSANVFGYSRSMRFDSVINRFMFDANFNSKINVYGDGDQYRAFISIGYLTHLLHHLLFDPDFPSVVNAVEFNFSVNQIIFEYLKEVYPEVQVLYVNQEIPTKSVRLKSLHELQDYKDFKHLDFLRGLQNFKSKFSF